MIIHWSVLCLGILSVSGSTDAAEDTCNGTGIDFIHEKELIACLMKEYNTAVRPSLSSKVPVQVTMDTVFITITDLNEKIKVLTTDAWVKQSWVDVQLAWQPDKFGGVEEIRLPVEQIWTPEIVLFNNADDSYRYVMDKLVVVSHTGLINWVPHARLRSFCDIDLTLFPFDTQVCKLHLGSWTYDESLVNLTIGNRGHQRFLPKETEWEVVDFSADIYRYSDSGGGGDGIGVNDRMFPTVVYTIKMKRVPVFYKYTLVAPSVILATLILFLFWIPPDSNERFMLASGILVSLTILLVLLEGFLPTDMGTLPVIAAYLLYDFILLVFTIVISIVTFNCRYRGARSRPVPSWIRSICLGPLSRLVCMKTQPYTSVPLGVAADENENDRGDIRRELHEILQPTERDLSEGFPITQQQQQHGRGSTSSATSMEKTMEDIRRYLRHLAAKSDAPSSSHRELVLNEWHQVALVVDRLLFWLFLLISIIVTIALLGYS